METQQGVLMEIVDSITVEVDHDHMYTSPQLVEKTTVSSVSAETDDSTAKKPPFKAGAGNKSAKCRTKSETILPHSDQEDDDEKVHTCELCGKSYQHAFSLKRHMVVQHCDERPFACEYCGKTFKINSALMTHVRFHQGTRGYECSFCGKHFDASQPWKQHELTHALNWAKNECTTCGSRFPSRQALKKHKEAGKCQALPYTCCKKTFVKKREYLLHRIQSHPEQRVKEHRCEICDQRFLFGYMLAQHKKTHNAIIQDLSRSGGKRGPKKGRTGPRLTSQVKCRICQELFPSLKELLVHSRLHDDDKPFVCSVCSKGLTTKCALERHERSHTDERPFRCSYCDKGFNAAESARAHERIHTGERPFQCRYCEKKFARAGNLQSHILTHTGERPYVCKICDRGFAQTSTLKGHMRTHGIGSASPRKKKKSLGAASSGSENGTSPVEDRAREVRRLLLGTQEIRKAQEKDRKVRKSHEIRHAVSSIQQGNAYQTAIDGQQFEIDENVLLVLQ